MDLFDDLLDEEEESKDPIKRIHGVTTGVVAENWDDKHPGMVKVKLFMAEEGKNLTTWMRVAHPYAGKNYGVYMLPEKDDEVLVAFNLGDPDQPYVIGSLWNNTDTIPEGSAVEKNTIKRIKTAGGHEILFDAEDGKETLVITTPGKQTVRMEDEKKTITIQDGDGKNILVINGDKGEVTVTADKKIVLDAGGAAKLTLDGSGKSVKLEADTIQLNAGQKLNAKGQSAKVEGGTALELKSGGTFKGEASAMMQLKGAMVKIN